MATAVYVLTGVSVSAGVLSATHIARPGEAAIPVNFVSLIGAEGDAGTPAGHLLIGPAGQIGIITHATSATQVALAQNWTGAALSGGSCRLLLGINALDKGRIATIISEMVGRGVLLRASRLAEYLGDSAAQAEVRNNIGAQASLGATPAEIRSAIGALAADSRFSEYAGNSAAQAAARANLGAVGQSQMPAGGISGLGISHDTTNTLFNLTIAAGLARDSTNTTTIALAAGRRKSMFSNWTAGNGTGGLDTGAVAAWTGYHIHLILNPTSGAVDLLFSASAGSPVMPSGFTLRRRIGSFMTDGSGYVVQGRWHNGDFAIKPINPPITPHFNVPNNALTLRWAFVPGGVKMKARFHLFGQQPSNAPGHMVVADPDLGVPDASGYAMASKFLRVSGNGGQMVEEWTNTSGQLYFVDNSGSGAQMSLYAAGWYDARDGAV